MSLYHGIIHRDYFDRIAQGGYSGVTSWSKIGFNSAVTTEQDMAPWLGAASTPVNMYSFPTAEKTMTIVSSSTEDDADKTPA